jgi:hypothetical protein
MKEFRSKFPGSARASRANASPARTEGALAFANFFPAFRRGRRNGHAGAHGLPNRE